MTSTEKEKRHTYYLSHKGQYVTNNNKEYAKEYRRTHKEEIAMKGKEYRKIPKVIESNLERGRKYRETHREHVNEKARLWKRTHPDRARNSYYLKTYGISLEEYNNMFEEQEGKCAICGKYYTTLHVDHNHKTGDLRGLLCRNCNVGIGLLHEDREILINALDYLMRN